MAAPGRPAPPPHVVVLGAGVCGLYAGRVLAGAGARVTVLEKDEVVGGLAAGREIGGNFYDLGVHHLHAFDRAIFDDIRALMGERLIPVEKQALIRYGRGYRRYPLEFGDMLRGVPPLTLARALAGLALQQVRNRCSPAQVANAEDALVELYGRPLYEFFFRDFTHRYWGVPPARLSAAFVRRKMPRLSAVDVVKRALGRAGLREGAGSAVDGALARETLWYSPTGAREMPMALADSIRARGGEVLLNCPAEAVETAGGRVGAVRFRRGGAAVRLPCDAIVSTIPLPALARAFDPPAPPAVRDAAGGLRYRPMVVFGLLVRRPRVLGALYVYFRDRVFHRVAEPSASGMRVAPDGHTVLLAEVMCDLGDDRWQGGDAARRAVIADLEAEGLLTAADVAEVHVLRAEHAYPVFDLGFEAHQATLAGFVGGFENARSTGRQGGFCYPNMHSAMRMGAGAAEEILAWLGARGAGTNGHAPGNGALAIPALATGAPAGSADG